MYLIDSDILIAIERGNTAIQEIINRCGIANCAVSEISLAELYVGVYKTRSRKQELFLQYLENTFKVIPISPAIKTFARIRAQLDNIGKRLQQMDILIAATALAGNYTLVTHNTKHFSRILGLKLEDWTQE